MQLLQHRGVLRVQRARLALGVREEGLEQEARVPGEGRWELLVFGAA